MSDATSKPSSSLRLLIGTMLFFLVLLVLLVAWKRQALGSLGFLRDESYLNLAVARNLMEHGFYGAGGERIPATQDSVWRALLAGCNWLCDDLVSAPYLLGALFGALTLLGVLRLSQRTGGGDALHVMTLLLAILGAGLPLESVAGTSSMLASWLSTLALLAHLRSCEADRQPLSVRSAWWLGLAALLRIEFAAVWLAFLLHALLLSAVWRGPTRHVLAVLIRGISGAVVMAILLAPAVWWNVRTIGVPWPRPSDAPVALDAAVTGLQAQPVALMTEALRQGWAWMQAYTPFLRGGPALLAVWLGALWLLVDAVRSPSARPLTGVLAVLLVPAALAPLYPFLGGGSHDVVWRALQPGVVLLAAYGLWRLAASISLLLARFAPGWPVGLRAGVPLLLLGAFVVLHGAACTTRSALALRDEIRGSMNVREAVGRALSSDASVITDRPGWLLYSGRRVAADLGGQVTPQALAYLGSSGIWDGAGLSRWVATRGATACVIWDPATRELADALGCRGDAGTDAWPRVCAVSPTAVP